MNVRKSLAASVLLVAGLLAAPASADNVFAGVWRLHLTPNAATLADGGKAFDEALIFDAEELLAENFSLYGFEPGAPAANEETLSFTGNMNSRTKGALTWKGNNVSGQLRGTLVWTKADGAVWTYTYTGRKE